MAERHFELVLTPLMCDEIDRALRQKKVRKYLADPEWTLAWLYDLVIIADMVPDTDRARGVCRDPKDDVILAAAVEGRAAVIVTGDDDLLELEEYRDLYIMSPREFLK